MVGGVDGELGKVHICIGLKFVARCCAVTLLLGLGLVLVHRTSVCNAIACMGFLHLLEGQEDISNCWSGHWFAVLFC